MTTISDETIEKMAEAAWNVKATIPWNEFFTKERGDKQFYLDAMRAAVNVLPDLLAGEVALIKQQYEAGDGQCYYCGKLTESYAANPGKWAIQFPHADDPGVCRPHHLECVCDRMAELDALKGKA